jgi:anti-anti-sigma factor
MDADQGPRPPVGAITIEREEADRWVLCLRGDVDTAVATRFANSHRRQRVVVDAIDAGGVTFISSSGLALMLLCAEASIAAGRHPVLRAASRPVNRALELSGIDNVFPRPEPAEMQSPLLGIGEDTASSRGEPLTPGDRPQRGSDGSAEPG